MIDRIRSRVGADDAGTSMIELVVAMALMSVFMAIFTGAILLMYNTSNAVQTVSDTSNQAANSYLRLDREVRYASALSTPAYDAASGMWHVEWLTNLVSRTGANTVTSVNQCTQLAVAPPTSASGNVGVVKQRSWAVGDPAAGSWTVLASNVTNYGPAPSLLPFPATATIAGGNAASSMQQLTVQIVTAESLPRPGSTTSTYTFTALNSSTSSNTPVCQQFAVGS